MNENKTAAVKGAEATGQLSEEQNILEENVSNLEGRLYKIIFKLTGKSHDSPDEGKDIVQPSLLTQAETNRLAVNRCDNLASEILQLL